MASKSNTQCKRLLDYMRTHYGITALEAWNELGIYRLASRISDLNKDGYFISKTMVTRNNKFGEKTKFAQYRLEE